MKQLKIFRLYINFAIEILINIFFAAKKWCLSLWIYGKLEIIDETSIPPKEAYYSELNLDGIMDTFKNHGKYFK